MSQQWKPGDVVKFKTGDGPTMVVRVALTDSSDKETGEYLCQWWWSVSFHEFTFPGDSLIAAKPY
ncbi:MAG: DUF2158 domain-containing protein [Planctomycetaceae bacterium]|nr:DUF2158 domain-containing protein [Planctomycetaceae bacterium]